MARRRFLVDLGRVTLGAVVLGSAAAACSGEEATDRRRGSSSDAATGTGSASPGSSPQAGQADAPWARVDLGFVSAYVVLRDGEAVVIDTGVEGSEGAIADVLDDLGTGWADVGHVILTHKHPDHVGSLAAVLEAAEATSVYAGEADIPAIEAPRDVTAVGDGDTIMDLEIVATPGHTPGHVSVLDPAGAVLFAGDALNGRDGTVIGPNPQFSEDMDLAWQSVNRLGSLDYDTVVFGHGPPVEGDAATKVAALERS